MRVVALVEVVLACCFCHLAYRAVQQTHLGEFERAVGRRYLPGCIMLAFGFAAVVLHGRGFEPFGVTWKRWRFALIVGLVCTLLFVILGGGVVLLGLRRTDVPGTIVWVLAWLVGTLVILCLLKHRSVANPVIFAGRWAGWIGLCLLLSLLSLPLALGLRSHQPLLTTVCAVVWLFLLTGFGEELFFRGYVQSRLNFAFGRPHRFLGMDFGVGLAFSSLLFGAFHALNTVDYFQGRFEFAWSSGIVSVFSGLCYGCLREKTESVLAGGIAHGLAGAMTEIPRVLSA